METFFVFRRSPSADLEAYSGLWRWVRRWATALVASPNGLPRTYLSFFTYPTKSLICMLFKTAASMRWGALPTRMAFASLKLDSNRPWL